MRGNTTMIEKSVKMYKTTDELMHGSLHCRDRADTPTLSQTCTHFSQHRLLGKDPSIGGVVAVTACKASESAPQSNLWRR
eukprot:scaffold65245_cov72-Phaeocystis_antarctica.AAC.2